MKRFIVVLVVLQTLISSLFSQSEAGAIFLLIAPGARAGGMGEAQVAVADDAGAVHAPSMMPRLMTSTHALEKDRNPSHLPNRSSRLSHPSPWTTTTTTKQRIRRGLRH